MSNDTVLDFYELLGFEEAEVDDGLTSLFLETDTDGSYVLITDEDGAIPTTLKQAVVLARYSPEGSYEWSATFNSSQIFKDNWSSNLSTEEKLAAIQTSRETAE
ncbi:MAG TPA: hypothetical protein DCP36_11870 [Sporomusaceae bacterium]|nr:hypothetical protein [Sporomusaceae bacterium]